MTHYYYLWKSEDKQYLGKILPKTGSWTKAHYGKVSDDTKGPVLEDSNLR